MSIKPYYASYQVVPADIDSGMQSPVDKLLIDGWELYGYPIKTPDGIYQALICAVKQVAGVQILSSKCPQQLEGLIQVNMDEGWEMSGEMLFANGEFHQKIVNTYQSECHRMYRHADGIWRRHAETLDQWESPHDPAEFDQWFRDLSETQKFRYNQQLIADGRAIYPPAP